MRVLTPTEKRDFYRRQAYFGQRGSSLSGVPKGSVGLTVGHSGTDYGYVRGSYGRLIPDKIYDTDVHSMVFTDTGLTYIRFGAAGDEQLLDVTGMVLIIEGYDGNEAYTWSGINNRYEATSLDLYAHILANFDKTLLVSALTGATSDSFVTLWTVEAGVELVLPADGINDFTVHWGDGTKELVTGINPGHTYKAAGQYYVSVTGACGTWHQNNGGSRLNLLGIYQWGDTGFTNLIRAFYGCSNLLEVVPIDAIDGITLTSSISGMFWGCSNMHTLVTTGWSIVTSSLESTFSGCSSLVSLDMSGISFSGGTSMLNTFLGCSSLSSLNISGLTTVGATNMTGMFSGCSALPSLDVSGFDMSSVTAAENFATGVTMGTANLDAAYAAWAAQTLQPDVDIDMGLSQYTDQISRDVLTNIPNLWTITDGGLSP